MSEIRVLRRKTLWPRASLEEWALPALGHTFLGLVFGVAGVFVLPSPIALWSILIVPPLWVGWRLAVRELRERRILRPNIESVNAEAIDDARHAAWAASVFDKKRKP